MNNQFFTFGHVYHGNGILPTPDLQEACTYAPELTLDSTKLSGFAEIEDRPFYEFNFPKKEVIDLSVKEISAKMIEILTNVIREYWDSSRKHVIAMSAGRNCRILMMILRNLWFEGFDLGDFEIRIHQHEHIYARDICMELGFPLSCLTIWREKTVDMPDHYRFAEEDCQPNANYGPPLHWFEEDYDYDNKVFVSCGIAGALFWYPYYSKWGTLSMDLLLNKLQRVKYSDMFYQWRWRGRLFNPFMHLDVLNLICSVPDSIHQQPDLIRSEMIRQLGYTLVPLVYGHKYNFQFSDQTKKRIKKFYLNSKFFKTFKAKAEPWKYVGNIKERNNRDMRLLGLALMYEGVDR